MHSPLVRCLLALALLFGQSASALHALEHLVPTDTAGSAVAGHALGVQPSPTAAATAAGHEGHATTRDGAGDPEHADGGSCTLCLLLGAAWAPGHPAGSAPSCAIGAIRLLPPVTRTSCGERCRERPPARAPPLLS